MIDESYLRTSDPWKECSKCKKIKSVYDFSGEQTLCKECSDTRRKMRMDRASKYHHTLAQSIKVEVLTHYGDGKCACIKCGFSDIRALSIDHISGNGSYHTKSIRGNLYRWLQKEGYPDGYQTLCMNCQFIKKWKNSEWRGRSQ